MKLNSYIDHTSLKPTITLADINLLCDEAKEHGFAAVCVPPMFVKLAKGKLSSTNIKIATVIGFPFGYSAVEAKVAEIVLAILDGVDKLDVVVNITAIKNNDWQYVAHEINTIMGIVKAKEKVIKVIIESGELTADEIIKCCDIYGMAGVDYVKTSTGYASKGATVEDVQLIRAHLADHIKIKASGGIKNYEFAKSLVDAGASRIGCSSSLQIINDSLNV
ncbi:MAG: deoxyribose-phosphate aldolase [Ginsengibacter sp.]